MLTRTDWQPSPELWQKLKPLARQMRKEPTAAEAKLWQRLRKEQIRGVKFRRQFAIDRFIADFCSPQIRLIIEVDGPTHQYSQEEDAIRQTFLEGVGFAVVRFTNLAVLNDLSAVLDVIDGVVLARLGFAEGELTPP
ncbi:MAG: endonuclease domain-containing protein [Caldilinea sp. CFX5]|nr:endonuclease domain-containing protein [Caldilinea sp. CFX5]